MPIDFISKEIPDNKLYVEQLTLSTHWHRHVLEHGPKSEAYVDYTTALIELEESKQCLK